MVSCICLEEFPYYTFYSKTNKRKASFLFKYRFGGLYCEKENSIASHCAFHLQSIADRLW